MGRKDKKQEDPFKKLKEWQDNQYNPGYYTGGNIPPYVGIPSKTSLFSKLYKIGANVVGVIYILVGVSLICIGATIINGLYFHGVGDRTWDYFGITAIMGSLGLLSILCGVKYIRNVKSKVKRKR